MDKLGLKLLFQLSYADQDSKPYLVYTNVYNNSFIDAKTGEVVRSDNNWGYYAENSKMGGGHADSSYSVGENKALSPKELEAVQSAASIIDQSKAEGTARQTFHIDSAYKLNWVSLYTDWRNKDTYLWNLDFGRENKNGAGNSYSSIGVSIDAKDGSIISYYKSSPYDPDAQVRFTESQSLKIAEDFIKSLQPEKFREVERTAWTQLPVKPMVNGDQPRESYFNYTRRVNGAYFRDNGFNITIDNVTGTVTNYNLTWYNKPLPGTEKIISLDQAYKILDDDIGMHMQYVSENQTPDGKYLPPQGNGTVPTIKLVYGVKPEKPLNIDAFTGNLLDNSTIT